MMVLFMYCTVYKEGNKHDGAFYVTKLERSMMMLSMYTKRERSMTVLIM